MGTGKNELSWTSLTTYQIDDVPNYATSLNTLVTKENCAILSGAPVLWAIKESFIEAGWSVVSCSYRSDATGSVEDASYYKTQSLDDYGQNLACNENVEFLVSAQDMWNPGESMTLSDGITQIPRGESHRLIYPVFESNLNASGSGVNLLHTTTQYSDGTTTQRGRSWMLLRAPESFSQSEKSLYIVLDYLCGESFTGGESVSAAAVMSSSVPVASQNYIGANSADTYRLGASFKFAAFYGEPTNTTHTPQSCPYRVDELNYITNELPSSGVNAGARGDTKYARIFNLDAVTNGEPNGVTYVNSVYNEDGGIYCNVTQGGVLIYTLGIDIARDTISTFLPVSKSDIGKVIFFSYSSINAYEPTATMYPLNPSAATSFLFRMRYADTAGRIRRPGIFRYFERVGAGQTTSVPGSLTALGYALYNYDASISYQFMGKKDTTYDFTTSTFDATYLELPVCLIDPTIATNIAKGKKPRYIGRLADLKIAPPSGINGLLAKPNGESAYDRLLIGGLWFPYNSEEPPEV
jgi:hypothetical protein